MVTGLGIQRFFPAFRLGRLGETRLPMGEEQFQYNLQFHFKALIVGTNRRAYQAYARYNNQIVTPAFRRCAFQAEAGIHLNHRRAEVFIAGGIPDTGTDRNEYMEHCLTPASIAFGRFPPGLCSALLHRYKLERGLRAIRQAVHAQFGAQASLPFPAAADDSGQQHLNRLRLMLAAILGRAGRRTRRRTGRRTWRGTRRRARRWTRYFAPRRTGRRAWRRTRRGAWQRTGHDAFILILIHRLPDGVTRLTAFRLH